MDSSRRSAVADRAILKKPRLGGPLASAAGPRPTRSTYPRIRTALDRDRAAEIRDRDRGTDGGYQPQPLPQQQFQELVAQYKVALADLIFNSKPIITNLTIIAGENIHAAKAIAHTVCSHILEVPSEQKLPSLYLLDSIVKNIARDYIKYFSGRLPEVFCKAYKQVDSSVRSGMRHLFGTWKGVFPPGPLQIIEKELGFTTGNGSSGSAAPKPDSQIPRPAHSIHVNPKYLEARQRLEQSNRVNEETSDDSNSTISVGAGVQRSDRSASTGNVRQWKDLQSKDLNNQRQQRVSLGEAANMKKEHKEPSDLSWQPDLGFAGVGMNRDRDKVGKLRYSAGNTSGEQSFNKRNGLDANHVYGSYGESGSAQAGSHNAPIDLNSANSSGRLQSRSWKNSEEEEFMWDDMNCRLADYGTTDSSTKSSWKSDNKDKPTRLERGKWMPQETERQEFQWNRSDASKDPRKEEQRLLFKEVDEHLPQLAQEDTDAGGKDTSAELLSIKQAEPSRLLPLWHARHQPSVTYNHSKLVTLAHSEGQLVAHAGNLSSQRSTSLSNSGLLSHSVSLTQRPLISIPTIPTDSTGTDGQQIRPSLRSPSPSAHLHTSSAPLLHPGSHISTDIENRHGYALTDQKLVHPYLQSNQSPITSTTTDLLSHYAHNEGKQSLNPSKLQPPQNVHFCSASSAPSPQLRHQLPYSQQQSQSDLSLQAPLPQHQPSSQSQVQPLNVSCNQTGEMSAVADVSGQSSIGNFATAGLYPSNLSTQTPNIHPPLPRGPPPPRALRSLPTSASLSFPTSQNSTVPVTQLHKPLQPPLPPGPPPTSSVLVSSTWASGTSGTSPEPLSNLLSSLLAEGLISPSSKTLSSSFAPMPAGPSDQSTPPESSVSVQVSLAKLPPASGELPGPVASTASCSTVMVDLIGMHFAPEVLRKCHPPVVNSLNGDLKCQCAMCGIRFKLQEELQGHLDWHDFKKWDETNLGKLSRRWFMDMERWFARHVGSAHGTISAVPVNEEAQIGEECEPMVPADETQCICALCGEPFEDFYSPEMDEWMYKGTVFFESPANQERMTENKDEVPIVHARCISRNFCDMKVETNWLS